MNELIGKIARRASVWLCWLVVAGALVGGAAWALRPHAVGPKQPIPFSHHRHAGIREISCLFCHTGVDRSSVAGMPSVEKCLLCHNVIAEKFGPIKKLHDAYDNGEPIRWERV